MGYSSFGSGTFATDMLSNPTRLQAAAISAMEESDTLNVTFEDVNNGFTMQMFMALSVFSTLSQKIDKQFSYYYPRRATTAEQLYPALSEFDYVKLMAGPANMKFTFAMDKTWIINNAISYDDNYNKLLIPVTSKLTMGSLDFGLYYPIEIMVNKNTNAVDAYYDTTTTSPFGTVSTNMLTAARTFTKDNIEQYAITFDMYQFTRTPNDYTVGAEQGFVKTLDYDDKFMACRVYWEDTSGNWNELPISLSSISYDQTTPTAVVSVMDDVSQVKVTIPQIYFTNGQIGQNIHIDLYTTKGSIDQALSASDVANLTTDFDVTSSAYAAPMDQMAFWKILPNTTVVVGGSDPMTFAEIRDAVVNQKLYTRVAVTPPEIEQAGSSAGFSLTKVSDDMMGRSYSATNLLTDGNGNIVPVSNGMIKLSGTALSGDPGTILSYTDGFYTILPTTTFTVAAVNNLMIPMTDSDVAQLGSLTKSDLVSALNSGTYARQPFHITLNTSQTSPTAKVYNLMSPTMSSLVFNTENPNLPPQMTVTSISMAHQGNGTGGFLIRLGVSRSENITNVTTDQLGLCLLIEAKTGGIYNLPATYVTTENNIDIYEVTMASTYHITADGYITVGMYDENGTLSEVEISITPTVDLRTLIASSLYPTISNVASLTANLPVKYGNFLAMTQQTASLVLGTDLSDRIYCAVDTTWGSDVYKTTPVDVYFTATSTIFQKDENGNLVVRKNAAGTGLDTVVLYNQGDTPSSTADITFTLSGNVTLTGTDADLTIPVKDTTGALIGMPVAGANLGVGNTIAAFTDSTITLTSKPSADLVSGATFIGFNYKTLVRTSAAQSSAGNILTVASTANLLKGQTVYGFDIGQGNTIASVDSDTQITLTNATTAAVADGVLLTVINNTAHGVVSLPAGSVMSDPAGNPIVITDGANEYQIPSMMFDARLYESDDPVDAATIANLPAIIVANASAAQAIDTGLLETSDVFYKPSNTYGDGVFGIGNAQTVTIPLALSFTVTGYVSQAVYNDDTLIESMETAITTIINAAVQGDVISTNDIASSIREKLGSNVSAVVVGGINNDETLQVIALQDSESTASVEGVLSLLPDGTVARNPAITVNWVPAAGTRTTLTT